MPQCVNGNWRYTELLVGKGSLYTSRLDASDRARVRATIINEGERSRLKIYYKSLERHQRVEDERKARVLEKLKRNVQELSAYQNLLQHRFRADQFQSLKLGFKAKRDARTPNSVRRWQLETRVLNAGFSKDTLRSEVKRTLDTLKPDKMRQVARDKMLQQARGRSNFLIDRKMTNKAKRLSMAASEAMLPSVLLRQEERAQTFLTEPDIED